MPLKLVPPREGKSPNYTIRGHYLGHYVDKSAGTSKKSVAQTQLNNLIDAIERGAYPAKPKTAEVTFLEAAVNYMEAGRSRRYIGNLIEHFGEKPLSEITQEAIDAAAMALGPEVTPASRSVYVYSPVSAILHHALGDKCPVIRHKYGGKGKVRTDFLWPEDAKVIIDQADLIDQEFGLYLRLLLYTGLRKSEGLNLLSSNVRPDERAAWIATSKNEDPRMLKLREDILAPLRAHLEKAGNHLFRFKDGGHFKHYLTRARMAASGLSCPVRRPVGWKEPPHRLRFASFHVFRHTFASWFGFYGGGDAQGLVATGNWRDLRSAQRYKHAVRRMEWDRTDLLPAIDGPGGMDVETAIESRKKQQNQ